MMAVATCTTYYVDSVYEVRDSDLQYRVYSGRHGSARGRIRWRDDHDDTHMAFVDPRQSYAAQVEGTALLRRLDDSEVMLQYAGGGWWHPTDAPAGLGSRNNALVVGRDCATNHTPWGSRVSWDVDPKLVGKIRGHTFVADVFGVSAPEDRFDLFVGSGISEKVRQAYRVDAPDTCQRLSWHPIRSLQEILTAWGYYDAEVDGIVGKRTISGVEQWLNEAADADARADLDVYTSGRYPAKYLPFDPAVFWWTRHVYCADKKG